MVHVGMTNNVDEGSFHLPCMKNSLFIFQVPEMSFFVKDLPYICFKIGPNHFSNILGHISCTIDKMVGCQKLLSISREKDKSMSNHLEACQI